MARLEEKIEIRPLGDSALIVHVREGFEDAPEETLNEVLWVKSRIEQAQLPGVIECTSAFTTVGIVYDPAIAVERGARADAVVDWFAQKIRDVVAHGKRHPAIKSSFTEVPVCFEGE